ncbi:hypothetical protein TrVE_jg7095 [Triparma verrucosa]|uniref:C-type lectin domain-containing protein n=1 Tax=Triparma verrucosa TaxID=1606542 RepID=A0A9W7KSQ8_9STRA|nr:hypothetical protein TrVE_jg7095 [Triparma verrucosa]
MKMILSFLFAITAKSFPLPDERRMLETCPVPQAAADLAGNCDFYPNCMEDLHGCSDEGYIMGYGHKYCSAFVANLDEFDEDGQAWILGTLTCLKNALLPIVDDPEEFSCSSLRILAFDSHVDCYIDNGFCEQIYNFQNPLKLAGFVADLLKTFDLVDFASFAAIKQVYQVLTKCPFHLLENSSPDADDSLQMVEAVLACPEADATWSTDSAILSTYRNDPIVSNGKTVYLGFKNEYEEACSSSGYMETGDGKVLYGYNYAWNTETSKRDFWEDESKGYGVTPKWWQNCKAPYQRKNWWGRWSNQQCELPEDVKFLGEECSSKRECANDVISTYADVTCSGTCMFSEESAMTSEHSPQVYISEGSSCSNSRVSANSCQTYGGVDPFTIDSSKVGVSGAALGLGCVAFVGGLMVKKNKKKKQLRSHASEMEKTGVAMV